MSITKLLKECDLAAECCEIVSNRLLISSVNCLATIPGNKMFKKNIPRQKYWLILVKTVSEPHSHIKHQAMISKIWIPIHANYQFFSFLTPSLLSSTLSSILNLKKNGKFYFSSGSCSSFPIKSLCFYFLNVSICIKLSTNN